MTETPNHSIGSSGLARQATPITGLPRTPEAAKPADPAFEVLLERLTARAAELEEKSKTLSSPTELPDAVDTARASLEEALHLGTELLEAYRMAQRNSGTEP